jgi:uncharacterized membrane protein YecN with MAPEG domain
MTFPFITTLTAGLILILQMLLAFTVSGSRGQTDTWVGDGGKQTLLRTMRRHGNLAENSAIFIAGLTLLELSKFNNLLLIGLCSAFVAARFFHAAGLSRENTNNGFRLMGGIGTYLSGLVLGGSLLWIGTTAAIANHAFG